MKNRPIACLLLLTVLCSLLLAAPALGEGDSVIDLIAAGALTERVGGAMFEIREDRIVAENRDRGDVCFLSAARLLRGQHVRLEIAAVMKAGGAFGIILNVGEPGDPFGTGWVCLNADLNDQSTRLFSFTGNGGEEIAEVGNGRAKAPFMFGVEETVRLSLEILPDGTLLTRCNGVEYSGGKIRYDGYAGCYPGVMTYASDVEFTSANLIFLNAAPPEEWAPFAQSPAAPPGD